MKPLFQTLSLLLILCQTIVFAQRSLIIPSFQSLSELRTAERFSTLLQSVGLKSSILLHHAEKDLLREGSVTPVFYGNPDALSAALRTERNGNIHNVLLEQIKEGTFLSALNQQRFEFLICNPEDPLCQYMSRRIHFDHLINLIYKCPRQWSDILEGLPSGESFIEKVISQIIRILSSLLSKSSSSNTLPHYHPKALYLSQCFQPFFNPQPSLPNIEQVGSFLASSSQKPLPDSYRKVFAKANKIIFVALDENEPFDASILTETAKSFPHFVFLVISGNVDIGTYSLGNIIFDKYALWDELFASSKASMLISTGDWTIMLNALYHSLPSITLGSSRNGEIGRKFIRDKGCGVDLSQKTLNSQLLQDTIREVNFNGVYRSKSKDVSVYLNEQNTHYLIPNLIYNFFSAKRPQGSSDL